MALSSNVISSNKQVYKTSEILTEASKFTTKLESMLKSKEANNIVYWQNSKLQNMLTNKQ